MAPQSHAQGAGSTPQHLSRQQWGPRARAAGSALTCLRSATGVAGGRAASALTADLSCARLGPLLATAEAAEGRRQEAGGLHTSRPWDVVQ